MSVWGIIELENYGNSLPGCFFFVSGFRVEIFCCGVFGDYLDQQGFLLELLLVIGLRKIKNI
jgi:hypothetical protein